MAKRLSLSLSFAALLFSASLVGTAAHSYTYCAGPAIGGGGFIGSVRQTSYLPYHGHYYHVFKVSEYTYRVVHGCP